MTWKGESRRRPITICIEPRSFNAENKVQSVCSSGHPCASSAALNTFRWQREKHERISGRERNTNVSLAERETRTYLLLYRAGACVHQCSVVQHDARRKPGRSPQPCCYTEGLIYNVIRPNLCVRPRRSRSPLGIPNGLTIPPRTLSSTPALLAVALASRFFVDVEP